MHNRASMSFSGPSVLVLTNLKESYDIDYPHVCVKGLFSGTTEMENGGTSSVKCKQNDLTAEFSWNEKREISGKIKKKNQKQFIKLKENIMKTFLFYHQTTSFKKSSLF